MKPTAAERAKPQAAGDGQRILCPGPIREEAQPGNAICESCEIELATYAPLVCVHCRGMIDATELDRPYDAPGTRAALKARIAMLLQRNQVPLARLAEVLLPEDDSLNVAREVIAELQDEARAGQDCSH